MCWKPKNRGIIYSRHDSIFGASKNDDFVINNRGCFSWEDGFFPLVQLFLIDVAPIATLQNSVSKPAARDQRNSSISHSLQLNNAIMTLAKGARGPHPKPECPKPYGAISGYHLGSA